MAFNRWRPAEPQSSTPPRRRSTSPYTLRKSTSTSSAPATQRGDDVRLQEYWQEWERLHPQVARLIKSAPPQLGGAELVRGGYAAMAAIVDVMRAKAPVEEPVSVCADL